MGLSSPSSARPPETLARQSKSEFVTRHWYLLEVKEKMFNPFFTTKPSGEGTGLGLSMTHDIIVKQHGGRIDVETKPGEFTEFIITLPRGT
jgi:sensor histidine kinase regulating citrate/malate metabolism